MRTWELRTEDGRLFGFQVDNTYTGRRGVVRTIAKIPGVEITAGTRYRERRQDIFCRFTLQGAPFFAEEPWGDNSRFDIRAENEAGFAHVSFLKGVFERVWWMGV